MSWQVAARKDWGLVVAERSVRYLLGLLVLVVVLAAYVYPVFASEPITTARFPSYVSGWLTTLVPLVGIVIGYNAVVDDRQSGALKLALALPHSRESIVLGTVLARIGVLTVAISFAMIVAGALVVYPFGELELMRFLGFVVLTVAFGALWTALGVTVSISVATRQRALILGASLFFLFAIAWSTFESYLEFALQTMGVLAGDLPRPVQFVFDLEPGRLFERLIAGFVDPSTSVDGPWYLSEWVALVAFVVWIVVPLGFATRWFVGRDL